MKPAESQGGQASDLAVQPQDDRTEDAAGGQQDPPTVEGCRERQELTAKDNS